MDETTPGAPDGWLSSSTVTGWDEVIEKTDSPPTNLAPSTATPSGATANMATGRSPGRLVTVTLAADPLGLTTARLSTVAPAVPGWEAIPGPGTTQRRAAVTVPDDDPHTGAGEPVAASTDRPATMGADESMVTE